MVIVWLLFHYPELLSTKIFSTITSISGQRQLLTDVWPANFCWWSRPQGRHQSEWGRKWSCGRDSCYFNRMCFKGIRCWQTLHLLNRSQKVRHSTLCWKDCQSNIVTLTKVKHICTFTRSFKREMHFLIYNCKLSKKLHIMSNKHLILIFVLNSFGFKKWSLGIFKKYFRGYILLNLTHF